MVKKPDFCLHQLCISVILLCSFVERPVKAEIVTSDSLGDLTKQIVLNAFSGQDDEFEFHLRNRAVDVVVTVKSYYSSLEEIGVFDNRCVALPKNRKIVCDLRLLDNLLISFNSTSVVGTKEDRERDTRFLLEPRSSLLKWVIAHELGHIALGHGVSDYAMPIKGKLVYDDAQQAKEIQADDFAVKVLGNLDQSDNVFEYSVVIDLLNTLIRMNLCPETFPEPCSKINPGVGIVYNSATDDGIIIHSFGDHPDFIARLARYLYIAGVGTSQHSVNYLAEKVIDKLVIENADGRWQTLRQTFDAVGAVGKDR